MVGDLTPYLEAAALAVLPVAAVVLTVWGAINHFRWIRESLH